MIHVNSFDIKYREDGSEEQFFSNLSVLDADTGAEVWPQYSSVGTAASDWASGSHLRALCKN